MQASLGVEESGTVPALKSSNASRALKNKDKARGCLGSMEKKTVKCNFGREG